MFFPGDLKSMKFEEMGIGEKICFLGYAEYYT